MEPGDLPEDIRQFLREHVSSIEQLEILLRLYDISPRSETSAELAGALYLSPESIERRLNAYAEKGIVTHSGSEPWRYALAPKESGYGRSIGELARLYRERRVSVINEIFSNPIAAVQSFADAFIIGKKKE
jgi:hypothetical protein